MVRQVGEGLVPRVRGQVNAADGDRVVVGGPEADVGFDSATRDENALINYLIGMRYQDGNTALGTASRARSGVGGDDLSAGEEGFPQGLRLVRPVGKLKIKKNR